MSRHFLTYATSLFALVLAITVFGCRLTKQGASKPQLVGEIPVQREIETAQVGPPPSFPVDAVSQPLTVATREAPEDWFLRLEEVIQITLSNSDIIRDIGGRVVGGPAGAPSVYDVALQEIDPQSGVEAALSAFDAQLTSNVQFVRDERAFNNLFFGGGATTLASNTGDFNLQLSKQSAAGTQFFVRNVTSYNRNNAGAVNLFRSAYNTAMEAEFRHPLLRGAGVEFNRIAGPNSGIGGYNGVVIARIRTDIALADFESAIRDLMRDVETSYWQLYFAYRTLDARTAAYEAALASWRIVQDQLEAGTADGEQEALARANFYLAKASMQNALSGGTTGGVVGVYSAERALRQLMGIPANDGRLIRPADEPSVAQRIFDWQESLEMALNRRVELRRQRWIIKQREQELLAAKNFLLSQIDLVGLYRWRGFGDDLLGNSNTPNGSAFGDLWAGNLQGWQLGLQYTTTFGKRREHAAMRTAELRLARERAVMRNQELTITNALSGQFAEMERTYAVARANFNRSIAERTRLRAAMAKYEVSEVLLEFVLQAQQATADADSEYYRTLVDYNLAVANMHYNRGTYLDYTGVRLSEGPWSPDAYRSYRKEFRRFKPNMNYCRIEPSAVSRGPFDQSPSPSEIPVPGEQQPTLMPLEDVPLEGEGEVAIPEVLEEYPTEILQQYSANQPPGWPVEGPQQGPIDEPSGYPVTGSRPSANEPFGTSPLDALEPSGVGAAGKTRRTGSGRR